MEDTSQHVTLQLRVGSKIYQAPVSSNAVAEVLMKGEHSYVAKTISENNAPISEAMGVYDKNVEVMSVTPLEGAEGNDLQVSIYCYVTCFLFPVYLFLPANIYYYLNRLQRLWAQVHNTFTLKLFVFSCSCQ